MKSRSASQRGSSLLMATTLLAFLFFGAATVLQQVADDSQGSGALLASKQVLYVTEAGVVAGSDALRALLYPLGTESTPNIANLLAQGALNANDALCADGMDCSQWYALPPGQTAYASGQFRLAASCVPYPCASGKPITAVRVRSLGTVGSSAAKVLEDHYTVVGP